MPQKSYEREIPGVGLQGGRVPHRGIYYMDKCGAHILAKGIILAFILSGNKQKCAQNSVRNRGVEYIIQSLQFPNNIHVYN